MSDFKVDLRSPQFPHSPGDRAEFIYTVIHPETDEAHSVEQTGDIILIVDGTTVDSQEVRLNEGQGKTIRTEWKIPSDFEGQSVAEVILEARLAGDFTDDLMDDDAKSLSINSGNKYTRVQPSSRYDGGDMDPTLNSVHKLYGDNADGTTFKIGSVENTDPESPNSDTIKVTVNNSVVKSTDVTLDIGEKYNVTYSPDIEAYTEDKQIPITLSTGDSRSSGSMRILKSRPFTDNGEALVSITTEPESWKEDKIASPDEIGLDK